MDQVVYHLGSTVVAEIEEATQECKSREESNRKALVVLERWFGDPTKPQKGQFADPALLFAK